MSNAAAMQLIHATADEDGLYLWPPPQIFEDVRTVRQEFLLPDGPRRQKARCLPLAEAADWLLNWDGTRALSSVDYAAPEWLFWRAASRYALGLLVRQHVLPDERGWSPCALGAEAQRREQLLAAMPNVCRCVAPLRSRRAVLDGFLRACLNHWARLPAAPGGQASLHDRWLRSLRGGERLTPAEQNELRPQVGQWQRPLQQTRHATKQLALRLHEPPQDSTRSSWSLEPLLQDVRDPSLLMEAAEGWDSEHKGMLLLALGQAAGISPVLASALQKEGRPRDIPLTVPQANSFLREEGPALSEAGFPVILPAWAKQPSRLKLRARVKSSGMSSSTRLQMHTLLSFEWEVALGGELLSARELRALARRKQPLVEVRGQWMLLDPDQVEKALGLLGRQQQASLAELARLELASEPPVAGLEVETVEAEGLVADFLARLEGARELEPVPQPAEFAGSLRPYQMRGLSWLCFTTSLGMGACLADDMGLGKTAQTIAWMLARGDWPALIVCPTSVTGNWVREVQHFAPNLRVWLHQGPTRLRGDALKGLQADVCVTSYALLARDLPDLNGIGWKVVVTDEAQYLKNAQTQAARAVRELSSESVRLALTGTPVENHIGDLWSLMDFLNPGWLGTLAEFRRRFYKPIQVEGDADALARLRQLTGPLILRRLKTDPGLLPDLPDKIEMKALCPLTPEQASLYQATVDQAMDQIANSDGIQRRGQVLALLSRLKQICNHPAQFLKDGSSLEGRSGKLLRLQDLLADIGSERCLIFSQFAEMGEMLKVHLETRLGRRVLFLHGGVPARKRTEMVEEFQAPDGPEVMVLSLKAGGTGLNLTAANHVIHYDRWWNPAVENQATDRAYRLGQKKSVVVHKFLCQGTLEEQIDRILESKTRMAEQIVGTGEEWLSELSTADLRQLVTLRAEALAE